MKKTIYIIFRNDDPGARSNPEKERKILELFERHCIPQVLAVIPNNVGDPHVWNKGEYLKLEENPQMIDLIKEYHKKGLIEIAQHGYTHQTNKNRPSKEDILTENEYFQGIDRRWTAYNPSDAGKYSEFDGLSEEEQREKIIKGQEYLERIFNIKLKSFIFPWNTYNIDSLKILKERGFKFVPCDENKISFEGLNLIESCNWCEDFNELYWHIKRLHDRGKDALLQIVYHSWEGDDEQFTKLDKFLRKLKAMNNVKFILPSQLPKEVPWLEKIMKFHSHLIQIHSKLNAVSGGKIQKPRFYLRDYRYYIKKIILHRIILMVFKNFGLKKFFSMIEVRGFLRTVLFYFKNILLSIRLVFLRKQKKDISVLCFVSKIITGGVGKVMMDTIQGLGSCGYQFHLFSTKGQSNKFCESVLKVFSKKFIFNGTFHNSDPVFRNFLYIFLKRIIKKLNVRIIYITNDSGPYQYLEKIKEDFPSIKIVDVLHYCGCPGTKDDLPLIAPYIDKRICISRDLTEYLRNEYQSSNVDSKYLDRIVTIYNGHDMSYFKRENNLVGEFKYRYGIARQTKVISFVGRFSSEKLPVLFVDIAKRFLTNHPNEDVKWVMAGDGPESVSVKKRIRHYGIENNFILTGAVSNEGIKELFNDSFALLIVSEAEGQPLVLIEAMSMNVPVISTRVGVVNEVINNGVSGFIVDFGKDIVQEFASCVANLILTPALHKRVSSATREKVVDKFSIENMSRQYSEVFDEFKKKH